MGRHPAGKSRLHRRLLHRRPLHHRSWRSHRAHRPRACAEHRALQRAEGLPRRNGEPSSVGPRGRRGESRLPGLSGLAVLLPLELTMRWEDPGPVNVPAGSDVGERLAALAGQRPWWPLVEPTPRWIRVRIGDELVADSRRALLHVQYGRGALAHSFLPTYY